MCILRVQVSLHAYSEYRCMGFKRDAGSVDFFKRDTWKSNNEAWKRETEVRRVTGNNLRYYDKENQDTGSSL